MKLVVVSGVNIDSGGALSIFRDCLAATAAFAGEHRFVALVHDRALFAGLPGHVEYREFPRSKRRWASRLWHEYVLFRGLSRSLAPYLWFSLHDVTPNVRAERRAVYCHNPAPFHRLRPSDLWLDPSLVLFRVCYGRLYAVNLRKNDAVVVQQEWMREEFRRRYGLARVVVAHPAAGPPNGDPGHPVPGRFVYPCFPRVFKNVEVACAAVARLADTPARLVLTIAGTENRYARRLRRRFGHLGNVEFAGRKTREEVFELYRTASALVFPSLLETWGMPLSEFRATGRPIFAADLPYAHETLSGYAPVRFFAPRDDRALERALRDFLAAGSVPAHAAAGAPAEPFAPDWPALWRLLLAAEAPRPR
ncbi:MAG: glycosyltransferase [Planctomycetota bacterium]